MIKKTRKTTHDNKENMTTQVMDTEATHNVVIVIF